jgi:hypothetical protein
MGLWMAMPCAWWLAATPGDRLVVWLGIAGGASLAQRFIERDPHA